MVTLAAADIIFRGFMVRGSGNEPDRNHAGIAVVAPNVILVENSQLDDVLFGIYVAEGAGTILRGNNITGKSQYDLGRKGDGIRIWYSPNVLIEQNTIHDTRDLVLWYSPGVIIHDNEIRNGRYGVHLMYTDNITISNNRLLRQLGGHFYHVFPPGRGPGQPDSGASRAKRVRWGSKMPMTCMCREMF